MGVLKKNGNYWIDFRDREGKRYRKKIGPVKSIADHALREAKVKIARKEWLGLSDERVLVKQFVEEKYLPWLKANLSVKTVERAEGILSQHLLPFFTGYLGSVTRQRVEEYKISRQAQVSNSTVNREVSRFRHLFRCAVDWGLIRQNPCKGIREPKEPPGRVRYLNQEELSKLLQACPDWLKPIVEVALLTGLRRGEILGLTWNRIDLANRLLHIEQTKTNERRTLPISDGLLEVLRARPIDQWGKLFPDVKGNQLSMAFRRAVKRAELTNLRFHDLRHDFASHLSMAGVGLRTVQTLLGHRDVRMTLRYSHLSQEHLLESVQKLNGHFLDTRLTNPPDYSI